MIIRSKFIKEDLGRISKERILFGGLVKELDDVMIAITGEPGDYYWKRFIEGDGRDQLCLRGLRYIRAITGLQEYKDSRGFRVLSKGIEYALCSNGDEKAGNGFVEDYKIKKAVQEMIISFKQIINARNREDKTKLPEYKQFMTLRGVFGYLSRRVNEQMTQKSKLEKEAEMAHHDDWLGSLS